MTYFKMIEELFGYEVLEIKFADTTLTFSVADELNPGEIIWYSVVPVKLEEKG